MPLGMEVGLGPGNTVLEGNSSAHGKRHSSPGSPISVTAELLSINCHDNDETRAAA